MFIYFAQIEDVFPIEKWWFYPRHVSISGEDTPKKIGKM